MAVISVLCIILLVSLLKNNFEKNNGLGEQTKQN